MLLAGGGAGQAQLPLRAPGAGLDWPGLTADDLDRLNAASARLYEGRSIGTVERWRNPDTRNAGSVSLARSFQMHDMPCRQMEYRIRFSQKSEFPDHYTMTWCRTSAGEWKIAQ
jgi:surface antigen